MFIEAIVLGIIVYLNIGRLIVPFKAFYMPFFTVRANIDAARGDVKVILENKGNGVGIVRSLTVSKNGKTYDDFHAFFKEHSMEGRSIPYDAFSAKKEYQLVLKPGEQEVLFNYSSERTFKRRGKNGEETNELWTKVMELLTNVKVEFEYESMFGSSFDEQFDFYAPFRRNRAFDFGWTSISGIHEKFSEEKWNLHEFLESVK